MPNFDQWLDLDLNIEATRNHRLTGCNPNIAPFGTFRSTYEDRFASEIYPREQWKEIIEQKDADGTWLTELISVVKDQNGEGSCVANAMAAMHEACQTLQVGIDRVVSISPMSMYRWVAGGPQTGSTLDDNINQCVNVGCLPNNTEANKAVFKHTHPDIGWGNRFAEGWKDTAALFKADEYFDIGTIEGCFTAIAKGYPVMYARDGHCILLVRAFWRQNKFVFGYLNSWGNWGDKLNATFPYGLGYDSESKMQYAARGAVCCRTVHTPRMVQLAPATAGG